MDLALVLVWDFRLKYYKLIKMENKNLNVNILKMIRKMLVLLILDIIFIKFVTSKFFIKMIEKIQNKPFKLNITGAILSYFLILFGQYLFVDPFKKLYSKKKYYLHAFLFGIVTYGIFDFTNIAIFSDYKFIPAIIDILWGGIINMLIAYF